MKKMILLFALLTMSNSAFARGYHLACWDRGAQQRPDNLAVLFGDGGRYAPISKLTAFGHDVTKNLNVKEIQFQTTCEHLWEAGQIGATCAEVVRIPLYGFMSVINLEVVRRTREGMSLFLGVMSNAAGSKASERRHIVCVAGTN